MTWWRTGASLLVALAVALSTPRSEARAARPGVASFELVPGVVVDPESRILFAMNPQRGIDAVEVASGDLRWSTTLAAKPLLVHDGRLVAQADGAATPGTLSVVVLKVGARLATSLLTARIPLPDGITASVDDALGESFRATASALGADALVAWSYSAYAISGAAPGAKTSGRNVGERLRLELTTGRVLPPGPDAAPPGPWPTPAGVAHLVESGGLASPLWLSGRIFAAFRDPAGTALMRWDGPSGEPLPDVSLFGEGVAFRYASADGRHLLGSKLIDAAGPTWLWRVHSIETGELVAESRRSSPAAPFFISGSVLVYSSPPDSREVAGQRVYGAPMLHAVHVRSGDRLWDRALRDTAYRGLYPPSARAQDRVDPTRVAGDES